MKNLYPKGKGKIHPSPASPSAGGDGGGRVEGSSHDSLAVLKLLPAAILALTAALGSEDKEVLAYLIARSLCSAAGGGGMADGDGRPRCRRVLGVAHSAAFDCGCFDCYTNFWSRWDCSPDRELIHQAIEAFEEHLASSEKLAGGKGRRRERREKGAKKGKGKERNQKASPPPLPPAEWSELADGNECILEELSASSVAEADLEMKVAEVGGGGGGEEDKQEEERREDEKEEELEEPPTAQTVTIDGQRRSGWSDVTGFFNLRFWSLWSPAA